MILISDTLSYRPDGTVSGVTRVQRETFTTPSGREQTEDVSSIVTLEDVGKVLDASYAEHATHNAALEQQIVDEREAAAADKAAAVQAAADASAQALAALNAAHDVDWRRMTADTVAALSEAQAGFTRALAEKDAELASKDAALAEKVAALAKATAAATAEA